MEVVRWLLCDKRVECKDSCVWGMIGRQDGSSGRRVLFRRKV